MESLMRKNCIITMKCSSEESFKWAVTRALHPVVGGRITPKLKKQSNQYNWDDIDFPTPLEQIKNFEKNNNILVDVLGYNMEEEHITSLRKAKGEHTKKILLLFVDNCYSVVSRVNRLLSKQLKKARKEMYPCSNCVDLFEIWNEDTRLNRLMKSRSLCDLCDRKGRSKCPYHKDLTSPNECITNMRKEVINPYRVGDMYINHGGDYYKYVLKEGAWTLLFREWKKH